jgi:heme exporter protein D
MLENFVSYRENRMQANYRERLATSAGHAMPKDNPVRKTRGSTVRTSNGKEVRLLDLVMLTLTPVIRSIQRWWLQRAEQHYLLCADVEEQRAREAQMNVAYYQKRAALARSARI